MPNNIAFARTTQNNISSAGFVVDPEQVVRDTGRQIDWDSLETGYVENPETISVNGAVAKGATAITVDALPIPLEPGQVLNFGEYAPVTVTVGASALANAVSITVSALSGPIPSGTLLDMGTTKFAVLTADAAAGATTLAVRAIPTALAGGETATFKGGEIVAVLEDAADAGATSIVVEEVPLPIADNATAQLSQIIGGEIDTGKFVKAGTVMCELSSGKIIPRTLAPGGETAQFLLATNASENDRTAAASGYGVIKSAAVYENLLPEANGASPSVINSTWKTELLANGGFWMFEQYADSTT